MHCIPKKPAIHAPDGTPAHLVDTTRPLSVVDSDNRLAANCFRLTLEDCFALAISAIQRGFLRDRSMLANVLDMELHSRLASYRNQRAVMILFDFKAAFPSLRHPYMWKVLHAMGVPDRYIRALRRFYLAHRQRVVLRRHYSHEFEVTAGVRQGCPISPLIFAAVVDLLLRRLNRIYCTATLRAFADDIGSILPDISMLRGMVGTFREFGRCSGLHLGLPKCVIIPLFSTTISHLRRVIADDYPEAASMSIKMAAKYLGVMLGPEANDYFFDEALAKYRDRVRRWSAQRGGLQIATRVYNVFVASVLSYLLQFREPSPALLREEARAIHTFLPGPGHTWLPTHEAFALKTWFHFPVAFTSLVDLSLASRARLQVAEDGATGGAIHELGEASVSAVHRLVDRCDWLYNSVFHQLKMAVDDLSSLRINVPSVKKDIVAKRASSTTIDTHKLVAKNIQRELRLRIDAARFPPGSEVAPVRRRLERWVRSYRHDFPEGISFPRLVAQVVDFIRFAAVRISPCVAAAVWSTLLNRWCTSVRFQQRDRGCLFQCRSPASSDCIAHYLSCPLVQDVSQQLFGLPKKYCRGMAISLGICEDMCEETSTSLAIRTYLVYMAFNTARCSPTSPFSRPRSLLHYCQYARDGLAPTSPAPRRVGAKAGRGSHPPVQSMGGPPAAIRRSG